MNLNRTAIIGILFIAFSVPVNSQENISDSQLITTAINNYFEGYVERDIDKLNAAFDTENGTMKVPVMEGEQVTGFKNRYFEEVVPNWGNRKKLDPAVEKECELEILNMDIMDGEIATAKIRMSVEKFTYIDMLSLHKIGGTWKITKKIYLARDRR